MKPEAQRIAIAEACGWTNNPARGWNEETDLGVGWFMARRDDGVWLPLPDYLNDRNAMWDAAEDAGEAVIKAMRFWLFNICGEMKAHHATAAQEAEAFLRAKGLWVEE